MEQIITGLYYRPASESNFLKMEKIIGDSDYYAEQDNMEFFFPENPELYDSLESYLTKLFAHCSYTVHRVDPDKEMYPIFKMYI